MLYTFNCMHVYRAWKNKLKSTKSENQVELYQTLSLLMNELDPVVFQERIKKFKALWLPIEIDFITYFKQYYEGRAGIKLLASRVCEYPLTLLFHTEKWAKCYRHIHHGSTDTNMYVER